MTIGSRDYISVFFTCSSPSSYWEIPHRDDNQNSTRNCLNLFMTTHQWKVKCVEWSLKTWVKFRKSISAEKGVEIFLNTSLPFDTSTLDSHQRFTSYGTQCISKALTPFPPPSQNHFNRGMKYHFYCKRGHIAPGSF